MSSHHRSKEQAAQVISSGTRRNKVEGSVTHLILMIKSVYYLMVYSRDQMNEDWKIYVNPEGL